MSLPLLRRRAAGAVLVSLIAAGCASTPPSTPATDDQPIVPGEALIRAESAPSAEALSKRMPGLVVVAVEPVFGKVFRVKFSREAEPVDESFTRRAISAFKGVDGVITSEPNVIERPRETPEPAAENP